MTSFFWRNFLSFWGAMAALVLIGMALTAGISAYRIHSLDELNPGTLARQARQIAHIEGMDGLLDWREDMESRYWALRIYILDDADQDLMQREVPPRMLDKVQGYRSERQLPIQRRGEDPYPARTAQWPEVRSWWNIHPIALPDGSIVLLLFLPFDSSRWEVLGLSPVMLLLILSALAVTAPLCWLLARHVTLPVKELRRSASRLASGDLASRTSSSLSRRRDALGELAQDFDTMAARIQALIQSREQLLRNVAHELRSPLARLRLAVELARNKDDRLDTQLDRIEREACKLDGLVGQTLQQARLDALPPPRDSLDLAVLVDRLAEDARFEARGLGVSLQWRRPDLPCPVLADRDSLASAVENVLRNALRHTRPDTPVRMTLAARDDGYRLDIEDGGDGVPEHELPFLFDPFYRVRGGHDGPGAGLGLSIARAGIQAHGGAISARNVAPHGLHVSMFLPRGPLPATDARPGLPAAPSHPEPKTS